MLTLFLWYCQIENRWKGKKWRRQDQIIICLDISFNPKIVYKSFRYYAWKGISILSNTSLALWLASLIPADLKSLMTFSYSFCICACYSTIHFECNGLMITNWRAILTSRGNIARFFHLPSMHYISRKLKN